MWPSDILAGFIDAILWGIHLILDVIVRTFLNSLGIGLAVAGLVGAILWVMRHRRKKA